MTIRFFYRWLWYHLGFPYNLFQLVVLDYSNQLKYSNIIQHQRIDIGAGWIKLCNLWYTCLCSLPYTSICVYNIFQIFVITFVYHSLLRYLFQYMLIARAKLKPKQRKKGRRWRIIDNLVTHLPIYLCNQLVNSVGTRVHLILLRSVHLVHRHHIQEPKVRWP